jgi:hypothetical protein
VLPPVEIAVAVGRDKEVSHLTAAIRKHCSIRPEERVLLAAVEYLPFDPTKGTHYGCVRLQPLPFLIFTPPQYTLRNVTPQWSLVPSLVSKAPSLPSCLVNIAQRCLPRRVVSPPPSPLLRCVSPLLPLPALRLPPPVTLLTSHPPSPPVRQRQLQRGRQDFRLVFLPAR